MIPDEINRFYTEVSEEGRLKQGLGPLEFERTKELISKFLPGSGAVIADVGGGPGVYAAWLSELGHEVHLVEPVAKHIKQAEARSKKLQRPITSIKLGEARNLDLPDDFADIVILHGPLYHLQEENDRLQALGEARRVLKPGGVLLGFAINYAASTLVGLLNGFIHDDEYLSMCEEELTTGSHNQPKKWPGLLTTAFFHNPNRLRSEVEQAGFEYINIFAIEGMAWLDKSFFESRRDEKKKANLERILKVTENDNNLLAFSPHIMIVGRG